MSLRSQKHTHGEWRMSEDGISVYSPGGHIVCRTTPRRVARQQKDNARLIAAAPLLLEACERAADEGANMEEGYRISRSTLEFLVGAIARATEDGE